MRWMRIGSSRICPTVKRGFSDAYGFWKTICRRRRIDVRSSPRQRHQVAALEPDLAGVRVVQAHHRQPDRRLAGARLADEAERPAASAARTTRRFTAGTSTLPNRPRCERKLFDRRFDARARLRRRRAARDRAARPRRARPTRVRTGSRRRPAAAPGDGRAAAGTRAAPACTGAAAHVEDRRDAALLADLAALHHDDVVGELADDAQVVRDEQHAHRMLALAAAR